MALKTWELESFLLSSLGTVATQGVLYYLISFLFVLLICVPKPLKSLWAYSCCLASVYLFPSQWKAKLHICFYYNKCQFGRLQFNYVSTVKISLFGCCFYWLFLPPLSLSFPIAKRAALERLRPGPHNLWKTWVSAWPTKWLAG